MPLRHIVRTRYPLMDAGVGVPTWNFDTSLMTFVPHMAKRTAPGPFAAAPIVQGKWDGTGTPDVLSFVRGSQISGNFYGNMDANQGAISLWVTPEWAGDDSKDHTIFSLGASGNIFKLRKYSDDNLYFYGANTLSVSTDVSGWVAGGLYHLVLSWDNTNTLDGTNYLRISIDDAHTYGVASAAVAAPGSTIYIGSNVSGLLSADVIPEGFTIYRRPLYDGTHGVDAGNGDEIALISAGVKPEEITGASDICFQLPTNGTVEELVTGTGEAWSFPNGSNLLGVGGFMFDGTYTNDGWADILTPTVAALADAEKIFSGGYKTTTNAANEGIYKDYTCTAGDDFRIRAIGHSDGTSVPKVALYDQSNAAGIGTATGSNASTRAAPDVLEFTGQAPAGCTTLRVKLINTDATADDITYWHQAVLSDNLIDNSSMEGTYDDESGGGAGTVDVAPGWDNHNCETDGTDELSKEAGTFHSGAASQKIVASADNEGIKSATAVFTIGKWYVINAWVYLDSGTVTMANDHTDFASTTSTTGSWIRFSNVWKADAAHKLYFVADGGAATFYVDDVSVVELEDVSLTVTPASEANSTEDGGIRVDGRDACTSDITGELGAKSGKVRFNWTPRHSAADFVKFGVESSQPFLADIQNGVGSRVALYCSAANQITIYINSTGASGTDSWNATGSIVAGTTYLVEVEYNSTDCTFKIDGALKATASPAGGIDFGANIPVTVNIGSRYTNVRQGDAVFSAP